MGYRVKPGALAVHAPCSCQPLAARARGAGIDSKFLTATLASFRPLPGKQAALAFAERWDGRRSVVLWGAVNGAGKTHLGTSLLLLNLERGMPARCVSVADFMDGLRARFDDEREQSQAYFDRVSHEPVLMLDDLGKEQDTPWTRERMSTLIDRRYKTEATTIVTTNLTHRGIAERYGTHLADRLNEWAFVEVGGASMRRAEVPA